MRGLMLISLSLIVLTRSATAIPYVTATYYPQGSDYHFDFTVHMDDPVYGFGTYWGLRSTLLTDLASPTGWGTRVDFRTTEWCPADPEGYIAPGGILSGFSGTGSYVPSSLLYFVAVTGPGPITYQGELVPTLIPEPTSWLGIVSGLMALGGLLLRVRCRYQADISMASYLRALG